MSRKLQAGRRNRRTERPGPGQAARVSGARAGRRRGHSPARAGSRGSAIRVSSSRSRPRCALPGERRPPLPRSGVPRSQGPARPGAGGAAAARADGSPRARDARVPSAQASAPLSPLLLYLRQGLGQKGPAGRRGRGRSPGAARAGLGGGDGGMPAEPGLAWCPPSRGDRGLSSLLRLLKSSFPGESGDVRAPASRWRGCPAGEAASSYPITDCQSRRPSPRLPGVAGTPALPPAAGPPSIPLGVYPRGPWAQRGERGWRTSVTPRYPRTCSRPPPQFPFPDPLPGRLGLPSVQWERAKTAARGAGFTHGCIPGLDVCGEQFQVAEVSSQTTVSFYPGAALGTPHPTPQEENASSRPEASPPSRRRRQSGSARPRPRQFGPSVCEGHAREGGAPSPSPEPQPGHLHRVQRP